MQMAYLLKWTNWRELIAAMRAFISSETAQVIPKCQFQKWWDQKAKLSDWQAPRIAMATRAPRDDPCKKTSKLLNSMWK